MQPTLASVFVSPEPSQRATFGYAHKARVRTTRGKSPEVARWHSLTLDLGPVTRVLIGRNLER